MTDRTIVTLTGPTCSGKSTIERELRSLGWGAVRSFTTRPQRDNEVNGHHYDFVTVEQIKEWIDADNIVERVRFGDHYYGSTRVQLEEAFDRGGGKVVVVCEPNGANQFTRYCRSVGIKHVGIYVHAPILTLFNRMLDRFRQDSKASSVNYSKRILGMIEEVKDWHSMLDSIDWMVEQTENHTLADVPRIAAAINGVASVPDGYLKAT
jgi:guanylate kinase